MNHSRFKKSLSRLDEDSLYTYLMGRLEGIMSIPDGMLGSGSKISLMEEAVNEVNHEFERRKSNESSTNAL
ncbi:hypothetical protein ERICV_05098 [Paenibacillus phage phiERICV]|uniref:Uncharacterized protein n=1 Tax=Paenibacillus larvae subsp. larvae TaxID=147375 RepID=A0A6C0QMS2_9BACL|nr:hypothetical protein [Paenibacillus larvae]QHZ49997.1 hypothetical protein ERICV_00820 [Paenibacillus larvae subsp. larvae]QHZ54082.1 hypothetical protein ERICV_05098 [Paenibacillus phage phiERICV]